MRNHVVWFVVASVTAASVVIKAQGRGGAARPDDCPRDPVSFHPCALAKAKTFTAPRTPDGQPATQGLWRGQGGGVENIEEHAGNGDVDAGPTWVVGRAGGGGRYGAWAREERRGNWERYVDTNVS